MSFLLRMALCVGVMGLCGCFPEQRFWWSPQGDRALVLVEDRLHLVEMDGELGEPLELGGDGGVVRSVAWLRDGTGFVCQRERLKKSWAEVKPMISQEELAAVDELLPSVLPLMEVAMEGTEAGSEDFLSGLVKGVGHRRLMAALMRSFEEKPDEVRGLLSGSTKGREILTGLEGKDAGYLVTEICTFRLDGWKVSEGEVLASGLLQLPVLPKVSPKHQAVAFLRIHEDEERASLEVVSLKGREALTVVEKASGAFDWMPDGEQLVFTATLGGDEGPLQTIQQVAVVQGNGELMKAAHERNPEGVMVAVKGADRLVEARVVATAILLHRPVLQVLPDGRVLFASQPAVLPAAGGELELDPRLFLISEDGKSVQKVETVPGGLPTDLGYVVASPDGQWVAVVESETDVVAVVEIATGKVELVSPPHSGWSCRTLPAWRTADELTFAAVDGKGKPKWWLWTEGHGVRCINEGWLDAATADWLKFEEAAVPAKGEEVLKR
ncbi:hypothetical protein FEM03_03925 [Phragmitibacter flavus]|uniref:WD40 repeat domain-containing protein n=1 Tax=Phragmitibacter flavus TaxID=2576071 RepID=A0A5R8KHT3_9BACT|nr:hypothetical protein [Phragmitibacter flavus]TLD71883.1 hypothetical protein FEM03_03925 [Phragmitibacter flavus]